MSVCPHSFFILDPLVAQLEPREAQPHEIKSEDFTKLKSYNLAGTFWGMIWLKSTSHALLTDPKCEEKGGLEETLGSNSGYKRLGKLKTKGDHTLKHNKSISIQLIY